LFIHICTKTRDRPNLDTGVGNLRRSSEAGGHAPVRKTPVSGPSYTASFLDFDLENIRAIKHGDALVE